MTNGHLYLKGGTLTGNSIYVNGANANFTMTGGTISENKATGTFSTSGGGGVYICYTGIFQMFGKVVVRDNKLSDGTLNNVYCSSGSIRVTAPLETGSEIRMPPRSKRLS